MTIEMDAAASDPKVLGWMEGFPPKADKIVRGSNGSSMVFPMTRWAFSHVREMGPTARIWRGTKGPHPFPKKLRDDLDGVKFTTMKGAATTWGESLGLNFTDGIVVLHKGTIVQERYFGELDDHTPHIAMSVTKSYTGLLATMLVHEKALDPAKLVTHYIPELAGTAYGDATVRNVMDMTIGVRYSEVYTDPNAEVWAYARAAGMMGRPPNYTGPETIFEFLQQLKKEGEHGQAFAYKTCNTEVLGWLVQRVAATRFPKLLSERIWQRLGTEEDAYITVDANGFAMCGGGLNTALRDLARFGEMMRCEGSFNGQQIVPPAVVADIAGGADPAHFAKAGYETLPGWSYRNQWWVSHNKLGAYSARGIHGQAIWIAPKADVVIARYGSHPVAANGNGPIDWVSLPAYEALAAHLMKSS